MNASDRMIQSAVDQYEFSLQCDSDRADAAEEAQDAAREAAEARVRATELRLLGSNVDWGNRTGGGDDSIRHELIVPTEQTEEVTRLARELAADTVAWLAVRGTGTALERENEAAMTASAARLRLQVEAEWLETSVEDGMADWHRNQEVGR